MAREVLDLRNKNVHPLDEEQEEFSAAPADASENFDEPAETEEPAGDIVAWTAPHVHHELISHSLRKFLIVLLFAFALLILVWQRSLLTALTFALMGFITSLHFKKEHEHNEYIIHPQGVVVNNSLYDYQDIESFCIHYIPDGLKELSLHHKKRFFPHIKIPLGEQDPETVRAALASNLLEDYHEHGPDDYLRIKLGL